MLLANLLTLGIRQTAAFELLLLIISHLLSGPCSVLRVYGTKSCYQVYKSNWKSQCFCSLPLGETPAHLIDGTQRDWPQPPLRTAECSTGQHVLHIHQRRHHGGSGLFSKGKIWERGTVSETAIPAVREGRQGFGSLECVLVYTRVWVYDFVSGFAVSLWNDTVTRLILDSPVIIYSPLVGCNNKHSNFLPVKCQLTHLVI